jgi:hypothetical protein
MSNKTESMKEKKMQHAKAMKEQLRRQYGEIPYFRRLSPKQQESFLDQIIFMEGMDEEPLFDILEQEGVQLPEPSILDDEHLKAKLWEVINAMARLGQYLSRTDHLSDRQLYEHLWADLLREPASVSLNPNAASCIDILGGCSEEDLNINLKYYADEDERLDWAEEYPEDEIPPHEPLPYDRDRHLPAPPFEHAPRR